MRIRLHDILDRTAREYPEQIAVVDGDRSLTYRELDNYSAELSFQISGLAPRRGELIGILIPKSLEAIVAQFAVLKASLAYVPLDVSNSPPSRLGRIIQHAEIRFVLTTQSFWQGFSSILNPHAELHGAELTPIFVDILDQSSSVCASSIPEQKMTSELDLAYVLFTSGSTGNPKGVMISHRNALTFINWAAEYFKPQPGTRFASHAAFNFDLSVFDIFVCFATGGELHLVPANLGVSPRLLSQWIGDHRIEYWYSVPSVWISILKHGNAIPENFSSLKNIIFAGEVFPSEWLARLMALSPQANFVNLYGPTETNVCTYYAVITPPTGEPPPIGRACDNYEVYVLNGQHQEVEESEVGELMVYGPGVTKGYYNSPDQSAEVFVKSPFKHHNGDYLYKTGDLVRRLPSGILEFVGRVGSMVKISGYRIELGDVENGLLRIPGVDEAVAIRYVDQEGVQSLGALVTLSEQWNLGKATDHVVSGIREMARNILPRYMVPNSIFVLEALPRNANGKIDRAHCGSLLTKNMGVNGHA